MLSEYLRVEPVSTDKGTHYRLMGTTTGQLWFKTPYKTQAKTYQMAHNRAVSAVLVDLKRVKQ